MALPPSSQWKKARVEDALHATRAAVEEGVVPGGGVALIRALKALEKLEGANEDQTVGIRILARAIEEPLRQIVENAGEDAAVVLNAVKAGKGAYGYNAGTCEYGDMLEEDILEQALCHAPRAGWHGRNGRHGYVRSGNARYAQRFDV